MFGELNICNFHWRPRGRGFRGSNPHCILRIFFHCCVYQNSTHSREIFYKKAL